MATDARGASDSRASKDEVVKVITVASTSIDGKNDREPAVTSTTRDDKRLSSIKGEGDLKSRGEDPRGGEAISGPGEKGPKNFPPIRTGSGPEIRPAVRACASRSRPPVRSAPLPEETGDENGGWIHILQHFRERAKLAVA